MSADNYVKEFLRYQKRYATIKKEIKDILTEFDLNYNNDSIMVKFEILYSSNFIININAKSIPFKLVLELNKYMGFNCDRIVSVGQEIHLIWSF